MSTFNSSADNERSISVIVVTLNEERNLPDLFESLRRQTDRNFDLLIVDGMSSDQTYSLAAAASDLVTHLFSEPDFGFYDALNKAVRAVTTDFYLVLGADDRLAPNAIENFKGASRGADIVIAAVNAGGILRKGLWVKNAWIGPSRTMTSHSVGTLVRKHLHEKVGYYSFRYPVLADWHFLKRVIAMPQIRVTEGAFVAGDFATLGLSNQNHIRTLCELWLVQRETGENPLMQYLLFQARLLRRLGRAVFR